MITEQQKRETLETVLASEEFSHSQKSQELLKYLVEASLQDKEVNEITIATDFFGKDANFSPLEDASIRVNVSQLRKRLANFYLSEGRAEKLKIIIPKGHYDVRFVRKKVGPGITHFGKLIRWTFPVLTLLFACTSIILWIAFDNLNEKNVIIPEDNPIWAEYLQDNRPTLVILGDYFFMYYARDDKPRFNVRDPLINSLEEFQEQHGKGTNTEDNLRPLEHTYLRPSVIWGFSEIYPILNSAKSSFIFKQASEIVWEDINSHNVIFIGTFKQLYLMKTFLGKVNAEFSLYPGNLYLDNNNDEKRQIFATSLNRDTRQYTDVCLVAKISGPNDNTIMLITSFHEGGIINGSKAIADPKFFREMIPNSSSALKSPFYFRCVLIVEGFRQTVLSSKIEFFEILSEGK